MTDPLGVGEVHIYLVVVSLIPANFVGGSYAKYQVLLELRWIAVTSTLNSASLLFALFMQGKTDCGVLCGCLPNMVTVLQLTFVFSSE